MAQPRETTDQELVVEHFDIVDTEQSGTEQGEESSTETSDPGDDGITWHGGPNQPPPPPTNP